MIVLPDAVSYIERSSKPIPSENSFFGSKPNSSAFV